jgi:hypothetical protein
MHFCSIILNAGPFVAQHERRFCHWKASRENGVIELGDSGGKSSAPGRVHPTPLAWGCPQVSDSDSRRTPLPQSRAFLDPFFGLQMNCSSIFLDFLLFVRHGKNHLVEIS